MAGAVDGVLEVDFFIPSNQTFSVASESQKNSLICSTLSVECANPIPILVLAVLTGLI